MKNKTVAVHPAVWAKIIIALLFVLLVPQFTNDYSMQVLNVSLIMAILSFGLSILLGMGGLLSFAGTAFMGLGAYIVANLTTGRPGYIFNTSESLLIAILACTLTAFLIGLVLLRLSGTFFTFATIALVQVSWSIYMNYKPFSGGPDGISRIPALTLFGFTPDGYRQWFYMLCVIVLICILLVERIRKTKLGRSLAAVRDNEIAAQSLGVNIYRTKVIAFTITGALSALAGGLYAMHGGFISADNFTFDMSTTYIIIVMLGGVNDTFGVLVGSILVNMLPEWLRPLARYIRLIYGAGVILLMVFMPMGLAGLAKQFMDKIKFRMRAGSNGKGD